MTYILIPLISALIGWFTNYIAVKMLFHPRKPMKLLFITVQGIFPKRQKVLAQKLGKVVATELFSFNDIKKSLTDEQVMFELRLVLEAKIDHFLQEKLKEVLPPMVAMLIGEGFQAKIKTLLMDEFAQLLPEMMDGYAHALERKINIEQIVADKVAVFSTDKLESLLLSIMQKEFRFIELLGGFLGLLIGIIQVVLIRFL